MVHTDRLLAIFNVFDTTGDGVLTVHDFTLRAKQLAKTARIAEGTPAYLAFEANYEHLWRGVSAADTNKDGKVTKEEFVAYWEKIIHAAKSFADFPEYIKDIVNEIFKSLDVDGNGLLSKHEYAAAAKAIGGNEHEIDPGYDYISHLGGGKADVAAIHKAFYHALIDDDDKAWKSLPQFHSKPTH